MTELTTADIANILTDIGYAIKQAKGTPEGQAKLASVKARLQEAAKTDAGKAKLAELKGKLVEFSGTPEFEEIKAIIEANVQSDKQVAQQIADKIKELKAFASTPDGAAQLKAKAGELKTWAQANPDQVNEVVSQLKDIELTPTGKEIVAQVRAILGK